MTPFLQVSKESSSNGLRASLSDLAESRRQPEQESTPWEESGTSPAPGIPEEEAVADAQQTFSSSGTCFIAQAEQREKGQFWASAPISNSTPAAVTAPGRRELEGKHMLL